MANTTGTAEPSQLPPSTPMRRGSSRLHHLRAGLHGLFSNSSEVEQAQPPSSSPATDSPKSPEYGNRLEHPGTRQLDVLQLNHVLIPSPTLSSMSSPASPRRNVAERSHTPHDAPSSPRPSLPIEPISSLPPVFRTRTERIIGVEPEAHHLAEMIAHGRPRPRRRERPSETQPLPPLPRGILPRLKTRQARPRIVTMAISTFLLLIVLAVYLVMALTQELSNEEFHVMMILLILISTIFFCHSLIQLCVAVARPQRHRRHRRSDMMALVGPGGYADPPEPIRVALVADDEAAGINNDLTKMPPPAYGLWRESVRMDPARLFWQRNTSAPSVVDEEDQSGSTHRPPSYMSDDGVDYVVEAVPRSTAPVEAALPPHPSEVGRMGRSHV